MIFGEGPIIKNIAGDLNKLFLQGTRAGQPINNVEGDAAADQATIQLMADRDPVIRDISTGLGWAGREVTVSGTGALQLVNSLGRPLKSWSVELAPNQDLNGYDSPWPAGSGVNKLLFSNSDMSYTNHGVTASYNAATEVFTVTGTESFGSSFAILISDINVFKLPNFVAGETYTISRTQVTGELSRSIYVQISYRTTGGTNNALVLNDRASTTFTVPSNFDYAYNLFIGIFAGATDLNNSFKIQLESGSTVTSWSPYENICPIYGTDKLNMFVEESYDQSAAPKAVITPPQTIYSGSVYDGGAVSSQKKLVLDGSPDENITLGSYGMTFKFSLPNDAKLTATTTDLVNDICNQMIQVKQSTTWGVNGTFSRVNNDYTVYFKIDDTITTLEDLRAYLASNPIEYIYELAEPVQFSVTTPGIPTFEGDCTTWVTAEDGIITSFSATYLQGE